MAHTTHEFPIYIRLLKPLMKAKQKPHTQTHTHLHHFTPTRPSFLVRKERFLCQAQGQSSKRHTSVVSLITPCVGKEEALRNELEKVLFVHISESRAVITPIKREVLKPFYLHMP